MERKSGYLPGLDGLRAIAIGGVLMAHDVPWVMAGHSDEKWKGYGGWGVDLFFAISGVLICWRLLEDEEKTGRLRLGPFYVRRLFRIQPAAWCYLAVVAILFASGSLPADWQFWWSAVLSYTNFVVNPATPARDAAFVGHFWTLAVEEHFYLLISLLFLIARRYRAAVFILLLAALATGQLYAELHGRFSPEVSSRRTYWIIQFLLFPALLALLVRMPRVKAAVLRFGRPWVVVLVVLVAMSLNLLRSGFGSFLDEFRHFSLLFFVASNLSLVFYGFGLYTVAVMLHPASLTTRLLELRPLRFAGRLSYSIYLWHVLFFIPVFIPDQIHSSVLLALSARPWKYMASAVVALLSYFFVEKPLIRFGHRLAPPSTAGHRDLTIDRAQGRRSFPQESASAELVR